MQRAPQITFRHMDRSPALEASIHESIRKIEAHAPDLISCHVVVEAPQGHDLGFHVRVELALAGKAIVAGRHRTEAAAHADAYVAVLASFRAALRELEAYNDVRHRRHASAAGGR